MARILGVEHQHYCNSVNLRETTNHDIFLHHRICPRLAQLFYIWVNQPSTLACKIPIPPDVSPKHLIDELEHQLLEQKAQCWEAVVVGSSGSVGHDSQLIAISM